MERVAFRPARGADADTLLVTSFAVSFLLQNLAILVFGALPRSVAHLAVPDPLASTSAATRCRTSTSSPSVSPPCCSSAFGLFLGRTRIGVQMRAAAENFTMARLLGVRANTVIATPFALSGLLAASRRSSSSQQTGIIQPTIGVTPVLAAFVATILGGLGSLVGAVLGGYFLGASPSPCRRRCRSRTAATATRSSSAPSCSSSSSGRRGCWCTARPTRGSELSWRLPDAAPSQRRVGAEALLARVPARARLARDAARLARVARAAERARQHADQPDPRRRALHLRRQHRRLLVRPHRLHGDRCLHRGAAPDPRVDRSRRCCSCRAGSSAPTSRRSRPT